MDRRPQGPCALPGPERWPEFTLVLSRKRRGRAPSLPHSPPWPRTNSSRAASQPSIPCGSLRKPRRNPRGYRIPRPRHYRLAPASDGGGPPGGGQSDPTQRDSVNLLRLLLAAIGAPAHSCARSLCPRAGTSTENHCNRVTGFCLDRTYVSCSCSRTRPLPSSAMNLIATEPARSPMPRTSTDPSDFPPNPLRKTARSPVASRRRR